MIHIKQYLSRSAHQVWDNCPTPPRYIGHITLDEYGAPRRFCAWIGRHPRSMAWVLFVARKLPKGYTRAKVYEGLTLQELHQYLPDDKITHLLETCRKGTA